MLFRTIDHAITTSGYSILLVYTILEKTLYNSVELSSIKACPFPALCDMAALVQV